MFLLFSLGYTGFVELWGHSKFGPLGGVNALALVAGFDALGGLVGGFIGLLRGIVVNQFKFIWFENGLVYMVYWFIWRIFSIHWYSLQAKI